MGRCRLTVPKLKTSFGWVAGLDASLKQAVGHVDREESGRSPAWFSRSGPRIVNRINHQLLMRQIGIAFTDYCESSCQRIESLMRAASFLLAAEIVQIGVDRRVSSWFQLGRLACSPRAARAARQNGELRPR